MRYTYTASSMLIHLNLDKSKTNSVGTEGADLFHGCVTMICTCIISMKFVMTNEREVQEKKYNDTIYTFSILTF
jgi:hypothetical protein